MFDPLNKITVDAIMESKDIGERELATFHFLKLMPNDLILLDRGYLRIGFLILLSPRGPIPVHGFNGKGGRLSGNSIIPGEKRKSYLCRLSQAQ